MSLRDDLAGVLARDPRYDLNAYLFIFEALEFTKTLKLKKQGRSRTRVQAKKASRHVTGQELCHGAKELAQAQYGLLALTVLNQWGIHSTSDLGNIVYNLIATGDLDKEPTDARSDFDDVFDFNTAFRDEFVLALDDVA